MLERSIAYWQFKMELIPMENDLLSMEMENVARDIYLVRGVNTILLTSLMSERGRHIAVLSFTRLDDSTASIRSFPAYHG